MSMDRTEIGVREDTQLRVPVDDYIDRGNTQLRRPVDDYIESDFYAPLTDSLITTRGRGLHTYTRATAAWGFDSEGKLNLNIPSGCPRFTGARLVRNRIVNSDPSSASWTLTNCTVAQTTDPAGGSAAAVVTVTASASNSIRPTSQYSFTGDNRASFYFKPGTAEWCRLLIHDGSGNQARFWFNALTQQLGTVSTGGAGWTAVSAAISNEGSGWFRLQALATITGNTYFQVFACDADNSTNYTTVSGKTITIAFPQSENVSGQADQTASEYVSVGVLSAPWHGAGVDGCKWFPTNKDGSAISTSTLEGYLAEPSRTNNCLWGRLLNGMTLNTSYTSYKWEIPQQAAAAELITNGSFTAGIADWTAQSGATLAHDTGRLKITTPGGVFAGASIPIACTIDKTYSITIDHIAGDADLQFGVGSGANNPTLGYVIFNGTETRKIHFLASHATLYLFVYFSSSKTAGKYSFIDNVSIKESAIQVTTTTGLDNIANSASRLTSAATDATITQLLTAATGTRTLSAYIKRVSGSGTISLTRDGGANWTDITSSLVTDSWVLVQMTSDVGANPTVGIKMGTSGDVIDVDCVQDENGAWATSPILTTTAAVTRNADVLSYASAFDVTQGTALCSVKSDVPGGTGQDQYALNGDSTNARILYWTSTTPRTDGRSYDGANTASATGTALDLGTTKRCVRWGADFRACADGTLGSVRAFYGGMGASTTLYVGSLNSGVSQLSGNIGEVHIWNTPLTDTQMIQVTK